ncbi:MAG: hypothetical protein M1838_003793 [Thelocarpon superellum]|nr:MAG: hypothetical protein M1838_003793 [Thelocarpon superellum]
MYLSWLFGYAKISFHHATEPITLSTKAGDRISVASICKAVTPTCRLSPLLFNGHLQTCWTVTKDQTVPIYYKRKVFEAEDPAFEGTFTVDFVVDEFPEHDPSLPPRTVYLSEDEFAGVGSLDSKPMLVTLHGLSGGSHELYLRQVLAPLVTAEGGWAACVINSRGCAKSAISNGVLYNARATWDTRQVVKWLRRTFPNRPLFGVGYSLGANILTNKYVGEEGAHCELRAAVVCSNPWNLEAGSDALKSSWLGLEVYSRVMANNMKRLVEIHKDQIMKTSKVDLDRLRKTRYLHDFDREVQCPTWGYPTVGTYYRDASSCDSLLAIKIPFFALNAEDDPVAPKKGIPYEEFTQNPYAVLCTTSKGGHLAWFESDGGRWFVKPITGFLNRLANEVQMDDASGHRKPVMNGTTTSTVGGTPKPYEFVPMRRKMYMQDFAV